MLTPNTQPGKISVTHRLSDVTAREDQRHPQAQRRHEEQERSGEQHREEDSRQRGRAR